MKSDHELTDRQILEKQMEYSRKQARYDKITCVLAGVMALLLLVFTLMVGPALNRAADSIAEVSGQLEELQLQDLELANTLKDIDEFVITSQESVQKATEKLDAVDLEKLNDAIETLRNVIEPLRRLFGE